MKKNKLSEQDIFAMLNEAASGTKVDEVCRKYKIANSTYYKLKTKYSGMQLWVKLQEWGYAVAKLRRRWRQARRSRSPETGFKSPQAAVIKSNGRECMRKVRQ